MYKISATSSLNKISAHKTPEKAPLIATGRQPVMIDSVQLILKKSVLSLETLIFILRSSVFIKV